MRIIITLAAFIALQGCQSTSTRNYNLCVDDLGKPMTREIAPLVRIEPSYPSDALEKNIKGHVKLTFTVNANGSTDNIEVIESIPEGIFDSASIAALKKWKYIPQCKNGKAIKKLQETILTFHEN